MTWLNGFNVKNLMIGDNVTEFDKITPETYEKMNEEFVEEGTMVRLSIPTKEGLEKWKNWIDPDMHKRTVPPTDMVADMWEKQGGRNV